MMMEQRFDFATDDRQAGFRLETFELYNWGTYDRNIVSLSLQKHNGLLTGDIGSGKSTIVDALTTLLVPHQKIIYNKAAGAETKERSLYSYIMGEYKSAKDENLSSAKAIALRDKSNFTVLLARFENEGFEEEVTLAQFFYISNNQVQKFFVVSKQELGIKKDFFDFQDVRELKKHLRSNSHTEVYESFKEYSKDFRRLMGIKNEQALNLFYQTVSLKSIGNLTQFIRQHMLEPSTMDTKIDELCQNFSELNRMHNLVLRAKDQVAMLTPVDQESRKYEKTMQQQYNNEMLRENLHSYFSHFKEELLERKCEELEIELTKVISQKQHANEHQKLLYERLMDLKQELKASGGERLEHIGREIQAAEILLLEKQNSHQQYTALSKVLELPTVSSEHRFLHNQETAKKRYDQIASERDELLNDKMFNSVTDGRYETECKELETEVIYLQNNRSNIPRKISKIRDDMAKALNIPLAALPFVGELIEVEDSDWEGAIERVLHSFALSLLVDGPYYEQVSSYVNETDLKGKLVYLKVDTARHQKEYVELHPDALLHKIAIKADSVFFEVLGDMLQKRFNIPCVENMEDFRRYKKALTRHGQFKSSLTHHEKDDRRSIGDSRYWVLGWDNGAKLAKLQEELRHLQEKITYLQAVLKEIDSKLVTVQHARDSLRDILHYEDFEQIDWYRISRQIESLQQEREALQQSSDIIAHLQREIQKSEAEIEESTVKLSALNEKNGRLKTTKELRENELKEARESVLQAPENFEEARIPLDEAHRNLSKERLTLNNMQQQERQLREKIQKKLDALRDTLQRSSQKVLKAMGVYVNAYPVESKDFDADIASIVEFRNRLKALKKDDLPKWEKRFKALFKEKTIQNIVIVQSELEHQSKEIVTKIGKINTSLRAIEYSEGTYIELMAERSANREIREFLEQLKQATSGAINADNVYDEEKFLQIKTIIERLQGRENYSEVDRKWRRLVTDVRNWYDFSAMERYASDGSEKEFYPHSGGKSGGQKEKLAYTVLASSLAYQFGLEYDKVQSRSFRFVMIDEAFGRGSDESSRYALRLFEKLNLQLLVITPKQKINIIEPFVKTLHFVHNQDGMNSSLLSMDIETYCRNRHG